MPGDTRHLKVASERLLNACNKIMLARYHPERSVAEAAVGRALAYLDLVIQRLEPQSEQFDEDEAPDAIHARYAHTRTAWQEVRTIRNRWPTTVAAALDSPRKHVLEALRALEAVSAPALPGGITVRRHDKPTEDLFPTTRLDERIGSPSEAAIRTGHTPDTAPYRRIRTRSSPGARRSVLLWVKF